MGGTASILPDKLSEREAMALAGSRYDQALFDSLKDAEGLITKEQFMSASNSSEKNAQEMFMRFCPDGQMDSKTFVKLCRDTGLIDNLLTSGDCDLIFSKAKTKQGTASKSISYELFRYSCVGGIAAKRNATEEWVLILIGQGKGPVLNATKTDTVRLHDDKSTYTGSHAQGGPSFKPENTGVLAAHLDRSEADIRGVKVEKYSDDKNGEMRARRSSKADPLDPNQEYNNQQGEAPSSYNPRNQQEIDAKEQFLRFCPNGEIDSKTLVKLCRDTNLIDNKFKPEDCDLIYQKAKNKQTEKQGSASKCLKYSTFRLVVVPAIGMKRGMTDAEVLDTIAQSSGPTFNATKAEYNKFHDDKELYTGAHAQGGPSFNIDDQANLAGQLDRNRRHSQAGDGTSPVRRSSNAGQSNDPSRPKSRQSSISRRGSRGGDGGMGYSASADVIKQLEPRSSISRGGATRKSSVVDQIALQAAQAAVRKPSIPQQTAMPVRKASLDNGNRRPSVADGGGPSRRGSAVDEVETDYDRARRASIQKKPVASFKFEDSHGDPFVPSDEIMKRVREVFLRFSPTGEMSSAQFIKMMRDAKLLSKTYSSGDAELIYMKAKQRASGGGTVAPGQKVPFETFCFICIPMIAEKRSQNVEQFLNTLANSDGPTINGTQADYNKFHDDKNTYTGSHAQGGPNFKSDGNGQLDQLLDRSEANVRGVKA
mmetsp:Transcript_40902/g.41778  ORF Transcript_40902/g.41778 Transcript_40902/m.41778 type:complete len:707 (-) Transcript_40902:261-2381(-)|eukprot:CAMPEP_0182418554 /NCGR_PEP_ID=MMETSP1167-20130531/2956_1 /TAXON_ID=2988 /ORGANISM="Mallomonas Sp, Strain CCMP3275" /LENGTH=706 /DNA_ID=CAMNT_0024592815 /DNA_START=117 /DNA_END=2237 /DNA_ORIENTATION=+